MTYNLTVVNGANQPIENAVVTIKRTSDNVVEFSGNTDASGVISATLTNSTAFTVEVSKLRLYRTYSLTTSTVTVNYTLTISVPILNFTGGTFYGQYKNSLKLNFCGSYVPTKKESSLNFWGGSVREILPSKINIQVI